MYPGSDKPESEGIVGKVVHPQVRPQCTVCPAIRHLMPHCCELSDSRVPDVDSASWYVLSTILSYIPSLIFPDINVTTCVTLKLNKSRTPEIG